MAWGISAPGNARRLTENERMSISSGRNCRKYAEHFVDDLARVSSSLFVPENALPDHFNRLKSSVAPVRVALGVIPDLLGNQRQALLWSEPDWRLIHG